MLSAYSASKAFISTFSQALGDEYKSRGIVVENVNTYFVVSLRHVEALRPVKYGTFF